MLCCEHTFLKKIANSLQFQFYNCNCNFIRFDLPRLCFLVYIVRTKQGKRAWHRGQRVVVTSSVTSEPLYVTCTCLCMSPEPLVTFAKRYILCVSNILPTAHIVSFINYGTKSTIILIASNDTRRYMNNLLCTLVNWLELINNSLYSVGEGRNWPSISY